MLGEVRITPSILNADKSHLQSEIAKIARVSDLLHLDIMDNHFVPNLTWDFGAASTIIKSSPLPVDSHLMVADVDEIAVAYAEAGSASVTVHAEACRDIRQTLRNIKAHGSRASLALKPASQISDYAEFLNEVDMVLIMTGSRDIWLQVDGGVSLETIEIAREAGADTFVAGSAVFSSSNPAQMVNMLRARAMGQ
jgi:ribulose-phosphate 3-epimerase